MRPHIHGANLIRPCHILLKIAGNTDGNTRVTPTKTEIISQKPPAPIKAPSLPHIARLLFVKNHNIAAVGNAKIMATMKLTILLSFFGPDFIRLDLRMLFRSIRITLR